MGGAAGAVTRAGGDGAFTGGVGDAAGRGAAAAALGSGLMMLTAGVEAADGNSALVGLPVGINGASIATGALAVGDVLHDGA